MSSVTGTSEDVHTADTYRLMVKGFAALRIFFGVIFLSNALAKVFNTESFDWLGFFSFSLISRDGALRTATQASSNTWISPLGSLYQNVVVANWGFFGIFLTVAELAVAIGLLFGIASRLAAVGGLLLITPIWILLWHDSPYLWDYPLDLFPLLLLAIVPAGRVAGVDRQLSARFGGRWPF